MKFTNNKNFSQGGVLVAAMMVSNFLNFVFNAFLGRMLSFEQFGTLTLVNTLWYVMMIFLNSLSYTVNHEIAYRSKKSDYKNFFFTYLQKKAIVASIVISFFWILISLYLYSFFKLPNYYTLIFIAPMIVLGTYNALGKGYLQAELFFKLVGVITLSEAIAKLCIAIILVIFGFKNLTYLAIPLALPFSFLTTVYFMRKKTVGKIGKLSTTKKERFPLGFYQASLFNGISTYAFMTVDILLAKHYLSTTSAGEYALLSLTGKVVFFVGSLLNGFILTFASKDFGNDKNPKDMFYKLFAGAAFLTLNAFILLGPLGNIFVPLLIGKKAEVLIPFLTTYTLGITLFTLSNAISTFELGRKKYIPSYISVAAALLLVIGIVLHHNSINDIASVVLITGVISFATISVGHVLTGQGRFIVRNVIDFIDIFYPLPQIETKPGKKRILIFNWRDIRHTYAGGAEVYIHELAKRWVGEGNKVTIFCGNDSLSPRYEIVDGVEVIRRGGFYFVYVWAFLYYLLRFRGRYDVVIDAQNGVPFFTPLYAKEKVHPLIFHIHQDVFKRSMNPVFSFIACSLEKNLMPWAYRKYKVITISESTKKDIQKLGLKNNIAVVYPGVDLEKYVPGEKSKKPLVLYIGRLKYYKKVDVVVKAAKKVVKKYPDTEFVIAGDGEEKDSLIKLAKELGVLDKITFLGKVSEEKKIKLYQKAWIFMNPSIMEGWGITSIEANACGTPVIAANVPGLRDSVKNPTTGFLVESENVDAFAKTIVTTLEDQSKIRKLSQNAIVWARRFDWNKSALSFLNEIL